MEFVPRLLHAGREQFGIVVELIIGAITCTLVDGHPAVGIQDFARFYAERSGEGALRNPFLVSDFRTDARRSNSFIQQARKGVQES